MKKLFSLLAAVLLAGSMSATLYQAVKVTSVQDGGLYMFERNGKVLIGNTGSGTTHKLQTTSEYVKVGIQGTEKYVWKLETHKRDDVPTDSFKILSVWNILNTTGHVELNNKSKATDITLASEGSGSPWKITFDSDDNALLATCNQGYSGDAQNRFLGEVSAGSGEYRAYAMSNLDSYGHDFVVYELQESTDPYIVTDVLTVDFGTVTTAAAVANQEVTVTFGNLTGAVTYSGLTAPFSASGTIADSGDKLTISAATDEAGDFSQTLTISSAADSKSAIVTVKIKVIDGSSEDVYSLYSGALVEGDYVIYYNGYAMNTTVDAGRLQYETVTPVNDIIAGPAENIVWHIAPSDSYWTIFNAAANKYAAGTGVKNKAQMLEDGTDNKALWTVTKEGEGFTFTNKANTAAGVNAILRNNGTNGFACYAASTGGALSLYKKGNGGSTALDEAAAAHKAIKRIENGQIIIIRDGKRFNAIGARIE